MITVVKLWPVNKTQISVNTAVNRTIGLSNQLPAEVIATILCKSHIFRKRVRKVIIRVNRHNS